MGQEDIDRFVVLFTRLDRDKNCCLDFEEFLRLLRIWGNGEKTHQAPLRGSKDKSLALVIPDKKKGQVGKRAGTVVDDLDDSNMNTVLIEAIADSVEDSILARQWNLDVRDVRVLRESFEFCDWDGSGTIDNDELPELLKNIGYPATTPAQKIALQNCRNTGKLQGDLDFSSILQLVEQYYGAVPREVIKFVQNEEGVILDKDLVPALYQSGMYMSESAALTLLEEARTNLGRRSEVEHVVLEATLEEMIRISIKRKQDAWRQNYGFDKKLVRRVKMVCDRHAVNGNVPIAKAFQVLEELDRQPASETGRQALARALTRVHSAETQGISVEEFLLLLRHLENQSVKDKTLAEKSAAEACGLDPDAVKQLRQAWQDHGADVNGNIPLVGAHVIFKDLGIVKNFKHKQILNETLKDVVGDSSDSLTFRQFLEVLHALDLTGSF